MRTQCADLSLRAGGGDRIADSANPVSVQVRAMGGCGRTGGTPVSPQHARLGLRTGGGDCVADPSHPGLVSGSG